MQKRILDLMSRSRFMILLASPESAARYWVQWELENWLETRPPETVLIALTGGEISWKSSRSDFDWNRTTALPSLLSSVFATEPLWVDLRHLEHRAFGPHLNPETLRALGRLGAKIRGLSLQQVVDEELTRRRNSYRLAKGVIATLLVFLLSTLFFYARARSERQIALSRAQAARVALLVDNPERALVVALDAAEQSNTFEARQALRTAMQHPVAHALVPCAMPLRALAILPPGTTLFVVDANGRAMLVDWDTARTTAVLDNRASIYCAVVDTTRRRLITGDMSGEIVSWDWTGRGRTAIGRLSGPVAALAINRAGSTILALDDRKLCRLWDLRTRNLIGERALGEEQPTGYDSDKPPSAFFFAEDSLCAVLTNGGCVHVFVARPQQGTSIGSLPELPMLGTRSFPIATVSGDPTGGRIVVTTASEESYHAAYIIDAHRGEIARTLWVGRRVRDALFGPTGRQVVTRQLDEVCFWDAPIGHGRMATDTVPASSVGGHAGMINSLFISPDGGTVMTGGDDGKVRLRECPGGPLRSDLAHNAMLNALACTAGADRIVTAGADGYLRFWEPQRIGEIGMTRPAGAEIESAAFANDGERAVVGDSSGCLWAWNAPFGAGLTRLYGSPTGMISSVGFLGASDSIVSGAVDGVTRLLVGGASAETRGSSGEVDAVREVVCVPRTGRVLLLLDGNRVDVWTPATGERWAVPHDWVVACTPLQGAVFATADRHGQLRFWDASSNRRLGEFHEPGNEFFSIAVAASGRRVCVGTASGTVFAYDLRLTDDSVRVVARSRHEWPSATYPSAALSVSIATSGAIAAGGYGHLVALWRGGKEDTEVWEHQSPVTRVRFSPDGRFLASASADGRVMLRDTHSGRLQAWLVGGAGRVRAMSFDSTGRRLFVAWASHMAVYLVEQRDLLRAAYERVPIGLDSKWKQYYLGE